MASLKRNILIGIISLIIGLLTLTLCAFEIRDGFLQGSRAYGMTRETNPITFYISTGCELLVGIGLTAFGIYSIRRKD
jgi:hypothetical protein